MALRRTLPVNTAGIAFPNRSIALPPIAVDFGLPPSLSQAISGIRESASRLTLNRCQFRRIEQMCLSIYQEISRGGQTSTPDQKTGRGGQTSTPGQRLLISVHARCPTWCSSDLLKSLVLIPGDMEKFERQCIKLGAPQTFNPSPEDRRVEDEAIFSAVEAIIKDEIVRSQAMALRDRPAEIFVTYLQETLDRTSDMDPGLREEYIKALRKLGVESKKLPSSLNLEEVTLNSAFPIASGGFSDVFQGKWQNKTVAVKRPRIFASNDKDNEEAVKQARREILLWRQLSNKFVLPLLGVFKENVPFDSMVSEWMPNGTLKAFLKQPERQGTNRLEMIYQVCQGVHYLHSHKPSVSHGDLKAGNIFVGSDMRPVIGDFGLSCIHYSINRTLTSTIDAGTVRWMAPELLCPEKSSSCRYGKPTPESDVWAFGMLMLEIFTDADPYDGEPDHIIIKNLVDEKILPPRPPQHITERGLDDAVWDLMGQCWAFTPSQRPKIDYLERNLRRLSLDVRPSAWNIRTETEFIPTSLVKRVITDDEAHWKALNVKLVKERGSITKNATQMTVVSITGTANSVAEARLRISGTIQRLGDLSEKIELKIPKKAHGFIIGKKRCHVGRLEKKHGVHINFPKRTSSSEVFSIEGPGIGIAGAKQDLEKMVKFERNSRDVISVSPRAAEIISERREEICRPPLREMDVNPRACEVTLRGSREGIIFAQSAIQAIETEVAREVTKDIPVDRFIFDMIASDRQTWMDIVERCGGLRADPSENHGLLNLKSNTLCIRGSPEFVAELRKELLQVMTVGNKVVMGKRISHHRHESLLGPRKDLVKILREHTGAMIYFPNSGGYAAVPMPSNMDRYDDVPPEDIVKLVGNLDACAKAREYLEDLIEQMRKKEQNPVFELPAGLQHVLQKILDPRFRALGVSLEMEPPMTSGHSILSFVSDDTDRITATSHSNPNWTIHERHDKSDQVMCRWKLDAHSSEALTKAGDCLAREAKGVFRRIGIIHLPDPAHLGIFQDSLPILQDQDEDLTFEVVKNPGRAVIAGPSTDAVESAINKVVALIESTA